MAELSEADVQFVKDLRQAKEEGRISRRDALKVAGALGLGGVVGGAGGASMFGNAAADASTSDSDGNVGLPGDRVDVFAEGIDGKSATLDEMGLADQTLVYVYGEGSDMLTTRDPANFADSFAAVNDVFSSISDSEQVSIFLPLTKSARESLSTTLTIPDGQLLPNLYGYGATASAFDYTATDGTPAIAINTNINEQDAEWKGFGLHGPGRGSASGDGITQQSGESINHTIELSHLHVEGFGARPMNLRMITGSVHHCHMGMCGQGMRVERMNAGAIHDNLIQRCTGPQLTLDNSIWTQVYSNVIDSVAGSADALQHGVLVDSGGSRTGSFVFGNYLEGNDNHVRIVNSGATPNRGTVIMANRCQSGNIGVRFVAGNDVHILANWFQACGTSDITLDAGGAILGPNVHYNSTAKLTDNTAGAFNAYAQSSGTYPW